MVEKLPHDIFIQSFKYVPRVALNLLITNKNNEILLTKRAKPPFVNAWHFPGSFLLKGESLNDCLVRIASEELDFKIDPFKAKLLGVFEDRTKDARGHVIDIMYGYTMNGLFKKTSHEDSKEIRFFSKLPEIIVFNHKETLNRLGYK